MNTKVPISAERRKRLDAIGFVRDWRKHAWEKGFAELRKFKAREGHCRVPSLHIEGRFKLGQWVATQRRKKDTISAERRKRLDAIGFMWDPIESLWEEGFAALTTFNARNGHCRVPQRYIEGTFKLGHWVSDQRQRRDVLSAERRRRLDEIGFVWDTLQSAWEEGFAALTTFKLREGHCRVPWRHVEGTFKLGQWINVQRNRKDRISAERRLRLDSIGFVWSVLETTWEEGFSALTIFKARERHCRVPRRHVEGTFKLGQWVSAQRTNRDTVPAERRQRLDEIGFVWRVN